MPTQEERINTLERTAVETQKFQQQAASHIRETEENTTILPGVIRSQGQDVKRMVERLDTIDTHLEELTEIKSMLAQILARLPEKP